MKVYISGPITGTTDYQKRFQMAENKLLDAGNEVINPAKVCASLPQSTTWEQCMNVCMALLDITDIVYLLPNWEDSAGAREEYEEAVRRGLAVVFGDRDN